jgi:putative transposase
MTNYRRNLVPGGSFFFTVNLLDRRSTLLTDHVQLLRDAFRYTQLNHPFTIDAIVVLPDHLHAIWTLPEGVSDFASRWRLIKSAFSRALPSGGHVSRSRATKAERGVWQRRYWGHTLGDEIDLSRHVDYIHFNPYGTVMRMKCGNGHIRPSAEWCGSASIRGIGLAMVEAAMRTLASDNCTSIDGFRSRSTHPTRDDKMRVVR